MQAQEALNMIAVGPPGAGKSRIGNDIVNMPGHFKSTKFTGSGLTKNITSMT